VEDVMAARPSTVSSELQVVLVVPDGPGAPVRAIASYDPADPYAVTLAFHTGAEAVLWTFARSLLTDGVGAHAGEGDVRTWPTVRDGQAVVCLSLSSPAGKALFELPVGPLVEFLTMTYTAVPTGAEADQVDLDAELEHLLRT